MQTLELHLVPLRETLLFVDRAHRALAPIVHVGVFDLGSEPPSLRQSLVISLTKPDRSVGFAATAVLLASSVIGPRTGSRNLHVSCVLAALLDHLSHGRQGRLHLRVSTVVQNSSVGNRIESFDMSKYQVSNSRCTELPGVKYRASDTSYRTRLCPQFPCIPVIFTSTLDCKLMPSEFFQRTGRRNCVDLIFSVSRYRIVLDFSSTLITSPAPSSPSYTCE